MASTRRALTLIELLIAAAIIGLLVQLILPAVEASREAARLTQCSNNLRQIGVGILLHEDVQGSFPAGGWGYLYVGDPDRGVGKEQPGGWIYNVLPFIGESELHARSKGLAGEAKLIAVEEMIQKPLQVLACPSRRPAKVFPFHRESMTYVNYRPPEKTAKSDYAGNGGDYYSIDTRNNEGPPSYADAEKGTGGSPSYWIDSSVMSGIFYQRSVTKAIDVVDGLSNTYLVGEKFVEPSRYTKDNVRPGDDQCMYVGADEDIIRWAGHFYKRDLLPVADRQGFDFEESFGSAHPSACKFLFCDGSVRSVDYGVDGSVHRQQANRWDLATQQ